MRKKVSRLSKLSDSGRTRSSLDAARRDTGLGDEPPKRVARQLSLRGRLDATKVIMSALMCASEDGDLGGLEELLSVASVDLNVANELGETSMHVASGAGHLGIVKYLQAKGANVDILDKHGDSPLYWAARQGHVEVVDFLVQEGVPVNFQNKCRETPLHVAVRYSHASVISYLMSAGASVNMKDEHGETPVHIACWQGFSAILNILISVRPELDLLNKEEETALHCAAARGHVECAQSLVAAGAKLDVQDKTGQSALHLAVRRHHVEIALLLLHAGCKLDIVDNDGNTPLHVACKEGLLTIAQALCALGCAIDVPNGASMAPLHLASREGHIEIVRVLCLAGCNVAVKDEDSLTPEMLACTQGYTNVAELLGKLKVDTQREAYVEQLCPSQSNLRRIKLKVFGDSSTGKTLLLSSLRTSFIGSFFRRRSESSMSKEEAAPTVANGRPSSHRNKIDPPANPHYTRGIDVQNVNMSNVGEFSSWEFSGYSPYHQLYDHFVGNTDCIHLITFRLTDPQEVQYGQVLYWMNFLKARIMPGEIGHAGVSSKPAHVVLVGTHGDQVIPPLGKTAEGDFVSSEADALLRTIQIRFAQDFRIHDRLVLLDAHQTSSAGVKALKAYLSRTKDVIVQTLTKSTGFLDATINHLSQLRKLQANFPVVSWPAFIEITRSHVNPLAGEVHCRQLIQQLQLMGEVVYLKGDVQDFDYVILSPFWLCHDLIGTLLSHEFLVTARVTGTYSADDLHLLLFPDVPDIVDLLQVLDALNLCTQVADVDGGEPEYEFPAWNFLEPPTPAQGTWERQFNNGGQSVYGGIRMQPPHGQAHMLGNMFTRFQVQLRRSMQEFQDPVDAELSQWRDLSKLCSGNMEALITVHRQDSGFEIKVRGPTEARASCFYFMEDLVSIAEQTVAEIAPGLPVERHFLSPRDLAAHAESPVAYSPSAVMAMQIARRTTIRDPNNESGAEESFLEVICFGSKDVALNLTLGIDLPIASLPMHSRRELASLLDPPDSMGRDWSILGATLGLSAALPEVDSTGPLLSKTDQILVEWSLQNPNATIGTLCSKLKELGRQDALDVLYQSVPLYLIASGGLDDDEIAIGGVGGLGEGGQANHHQYLDPGSNNNNNNNNNYVVVDGGKEAVVKKSPHLGAGRMGGYVTEGGAKSSGGDSGVVSNSGSSNSNMTLSSLDGLGNAARGSRDSPLSGIQPSGDSGTCSPHSQEHQSLPSPSYGKNVDNNLSLANKSSSNEGSPPGGNSNLTVGSKSSTRTSQVSAGSQSLNNFSSNKMIVV